MVYDASAKTLKAYLDNVLELTFSGFDLEAILDLDEGRAWMGLTAANGIREDNGNSLLHIWVATVPQSCEDVFWEKPFVEWNSFGYNGDTYDHRLTGDFLQAGDIINEELVYLSDDIGLDPGVGEDIDQIIAGANGKWRVVSDTRHGIQGLWRGRFDANQEDGEFDSHGIDINRESIQDFFDGGGIVGTAVFGQIMKLDGTEIEVARHRITYRFVKISPETTQGGSDCYDLLQRIHQITRKDDAFNVDLWPFADTVPPLLPCPPP